MNLVPVENHIGHANKLTPSEYDYAKKLLALVGNDEEPLCGFTSMKEGVSWKTVCGVILPSGNYRFANAVSEEIPGNLITGLYYGYSPCCIKYFLKMRYTRDVKINQKTVGYLQCPDCSKLPPEEAIASINSRRVCHTPFPIDRDEQNIMHRWYYAATTDFTDIVNYCKES